MSGGTVDYPTTAKTATDPLRELPGLEQFLAWQTLRLADHTANFVEQGVADKVFQVVSIQPAAFTGMFH